MSKKCVKNEVEVAFEEEFRMSLELFISIEHRRIHYHTHRHTHTPVCCYVSFAKRWRKGGEILTSFLNKTRLWFIIYDDDIWYMDMYTY